MEADAALYLCLTILGVAFFRNMDTEGAKILRRPSWAPVCLMRAVKQIHPCSVLAMMVTGCVLAGSAEARARLAWRLAFFAAVLLADMHAFAAYGGHPGFCLLYAAAALVLPAGAGRDGVFRMIVAWQLGSSALIRLRVAGFRALHPDSARSWLRFTLNADAPFKTHPLVEPQGLTHKWLIRCIIDYDWLLFILNTLGVVTEVSAVPIALFGGPVSCMLLFALGSVFHLSVAVLAGIIFPFNVPVYAYALLRAAAQNPACVLASPAPAAALLLGCVSLFCIEDWPLSHMALFPFNGQVEGLLQLMGRFTLKPPGAGLDEGAAEKGELQSRQCVVGLCVSALPSVYNVDFQHALGEVAVRDGAKPLLDDQATHIRLQRWLATKKPFVEQQTFRCFEFLTPLDTTPGEKVPHRLWGA